MRSGQPRAPPRLWSLHGRGSSTAAKCASSLAGRSPPRVPGSRPRHGLRHSPAVECRLRGNLPDSPSAVSAVGVHVPAAPSRTGGAHAELLLATYAAGVEDLLGRVERACAAAGSPTKRIQAGVAALLERLASRPELARRVLIDAPAAGRSVGRARAEAHRRFGELVIGLDEEFSPPRETVAAAVRAIENVLAANLLGGGAASLTKLAPVVTQVVTSLGTGERSAAPPNRPRPPGRRGPRGSGMSAGRRAHPG